MVAPSEQITGQQTPFRRQNRKWSLGFTLGRSTKLAFTRSSKNCRIFPVGCQIFQQASENNGLRITQAKSACAIRQQKRKIKMKTRIRKRSKSKMKIKRRKRRSRTANGVIS